MIALEVKAREDFIKTGLDEDYWKTFWVGYLSAVKRFGGL